MPLNILLLFLAFVESVDSVTKIRVGILLMTEATEPFDLLRVGPALDIAFNVSKYEYGVEFEPIYHNYTGFCPKEKVIGHLSELYYHQNVSAVIGPACSATLVAAGRLAQYLGLPMVTGVGDLIIRDPQDKDMYTTLTRMSYNIGKLSSSIRAIMTEYGWRHVAILYDQDYVFFNLAGSSLALDFKAMNDMPRPLDIPFKASKLSDTGSLLQEASKYARLFIIFCDSDLLRTFLYRANQLGMAEGDYIFISMELFPSDWLGYYMFFTRGDYMDSAVTKAYQSLLLLTVRQPDNAEYLKFADEVIMRSKRDYNYTFGTEEVVNYFITAFYDGALYLAESYNRTIADGGNIYDGKTVAQKMWNNTFNGITGPVAIDKNGDRIADFDLFHMQDPNNKEFKLIGRFRGSTQRYLITGTQITWLKGLPLDVPRCGFSGELCTEQDENYTLPILIGVISFILICGTIVGYIINRKLKYDAELESKTWLVSKEELQITKRDMNGSFLSKSRLSVFEDQMSKGTDSSDYQQVFIKVGLCRGNVVALKKIRLKVIEQDKLILKEFREMQHIQHKNLARFIGMVMEQDNNVLLMEYCPRGSLQDIIENDDIDLDWSFRFSLIWDIIKGLDYIHNSSMKFHGRLKSSNCVIDSRFMLKLTDFGPHSIFERELHDVLTDKVNFNWSRLLWTAPEILRSLNQYTSNASYNKQKADIYSLGIVLQEIAVRGAPFENSNLTSIEIIEKVRSPSNDEVFRPDIDHIHCSKQLKSVIISCWSEDPLSRPNITDIQLALREVNEGKSGSIMDNLMKRMEQYANNLEVLVTERTKAYIEEKKRAEDLLYRLLPPFVAKQLESGNSVSPETFDCVTIYFSDIVGFTRIAAQSQPMQVVDFLNSLYTCFDTIIHNFDVYKVETIGDAYMVVSGLPVRNGTKHAQEIANMSLDIMESTKSFKIAHLPEEKLQIRIGIHSGQVVAGVVGIAMPRYCLFGDTVNTASRMESTSEASRIQLSSTTCKILDSNYEFYTELRGEIQVKGKGTMLTYWLLGRM